MSGPIEVLCVGRPGATVRAAARVDPFVVDVADHIDDAITALRSREYDVLVTAQSLPDGTGLSLIDHVADTIPVVLCPDTGSEALAGDALAAGADAYVPSHEAAELLPERLYAIVEQSDQPQPTGRTERSQPTGGASQTKPIDEQPGRSRNELSTQRHLSLVIEQSPLAIIEWTPSFEVAHWNPAAAELFGYSREAAVGRRPTELILPADERDSVEAAWTELVDGERSLLHGVNENLTASGDRITCEWHNVPLSDEYGEIIGVLSFVRDVTDEVRRAETLSALHESTRSLFRASSRVAVADRIAEAAVDVLGMACAELRLYDPESEQLEIAASAGDEHDPPLEEPTAAIRNVFDTQSVQYIDRIDADESGSGAEPIRSLVGYPLEQHGVLVLGSKAADAFDDIDRSLGRVLAAAGTAAFDQQERERSLKRSRAIVEAIGDGVYALDENGRLVAVNDTLAAMAGYSVPELEGQHVSELLDDASLERGQQLVRGILSGDNPVDSPTAVTSNRTEEFELQHKNGDLIPCEITVSVLRDGGAFDGTVGIVRDITDRKRMEATVRDRKRKIEALYDVTSRLETCHDRGEIYEVAVDAALDIFAADACSIAEQDGDMLVVRGTAPSELPYHDQLPIDGSLPGQAYREGSRRLLDAGSAQAETILDCDEQQSLLVVPISEYGVIEITSTEPDTFDENDAELVELFLSHVGAALDRLSYEAELRTERDRLAALFENVPDPVVTTEYVDGEPIVTDVNGAFEDVFGYDAESVLGESIDDFIVPSKHTEEANTLGKRGANGEAFEVEVERKTATGLRDFLLRVVPLDIDREPSVTYAVYTDITERKQRQKRVEVLNRVLRHDLRNGMNIVKGSAEIIKDRAESTEPESHARTIEQRADELIGLAEKTRAVERTLGGDNRAEGPIDLVRPTGRAIERIHEKYPDAAFRFDHPETAMARTDDTIEGALYHILHNAVVHNDEQIPQVDVAIENDGSAVEIRIADNGPGIPETEYELITEEREITQLRHASGLGLWVANWTITRCGGSIEFEENEPKGTIVTVRLPAASEEDDDVAETEPI